MDSIGRCEVTERLLVAFVGRSHGIEREIPTRVSSWLLPTLRVTDISVPGHMWRRLRGNGGVIIRIGDPDVYVSGGREYTIQYRTSPPAIGRKISWNLAGPRWWTDLNGVSWSRSPSCHAYRAGGNRSPGTDTSGSMRHGCIPLCIWLPSVRACTPFSSGTAHIPCPSHANSAPFPFLNRMIGESSNSSPPADCHCPPPSPVAITLTHRRLLYASVLTPQPFRTDAQLKTLPRPPAVTADIRDEGRGRKKVIISHAMGIPSERSTLKQWQSSPEVEPHGVCSRTLRMWPFPETRYFGPRPTD